MIPIKIDISDLAGEFQMREVQIRNLRSVILNSLVADFVNKLEHNAINELKSSRRQYLSAIYVNKTSDTTAVVGLNPASKLALMIEGGASSFDMKEGFSKSSKAKYDSKGDWYMSIPFRHATPDAVGESELFSNRIPQEVYDIAKRNQGAPVTRQQLPSEFRQVGQNPTTGYRHRSPIFEGLTRSNVSATSNENRGQYMTFRRVSKNSDPKSWIHKGIQARGFMNKSLINMDIPTLVDNVTNNFLAGL